MAERLLVVRDRILVEMSNAERARDLQCSVGLRQLPEPAEQTARCAPRE